jgi:hypothetical protein
MALTLRYTCQNIANNIAWISEDDATSSVALFPSLLYNNQRGDFLRVTRRLNLTAVEAWVPPSPPAASAAGGWGKPFSVCI